ncbi:sensor histidine kinase [Haloarchaeobius iranensis]|uniref:histidine kinase n=1 Tax=Haloarchaeobius iranensis TaxID=996166 RepID=A0A1G9XDU3_9EURY|nr:histidine kinase N-terminal 7TM domain-containing protein [Haloarchaeobius iranensis]SDM94711.1 PAS domain S-box-containing protein [Haloarchaeobius iranensis]
MPYELTSLALPYVAAFVLTAGLWVLLWRHRERRAAKGFLLDVTGVVLLSAVVALKVSATDPATKLFWWNWRFLAVSFMSIGYMLMAIQYTDNEHVLTRRVVAGLVAVVAAVQVVVWTNGTDGLFYTAGELQNGLLVPAFGPLYWAYATFMVGCIVVGVGLLLGLFRSRRGFALQTGVLVGTITLVMGGVVFWWLRAVPLDTLALTSAVKVLAFYLAVERLQLLDTLPVARATVFNNMEAAVFVLTDTGHIVDVNPTAEALVGGRHVTHESIDDVLGVPVADALVEAGNDADGERIADREVTLERDGERRYYDLKLSRFPDGTGAVAVFHDISERRNREEEITILNRIVRHDIRNEMNVLHGRGQLLEPHVDPAGEDDYRLVMESAEHVIEITETVRELMETITSDGTLTLKPVALGNLLTTEVEKARSNFPHASFHLGDIPSVRVDGNEMLASVFTNLLNNAVVHNDDAEPEVRVDCTVADWVARVRITDDGPGVPPGQREEIFGRGEKGIESEGTGVGLYLVDTLTDAFGGDVWVEDAEQGGAVFVVELQLADATGDTPVGSPVAEDY